MPNEEFYKKVPVAVPHKSGFDKSFRNLFTAKCGTLVPIFCDEVIPNTSVHLDLALSAQLPPLASETFMNVDYKVEAFFCPTRLLMANYEDWLSRNDKISNAAGTLTKYLRAPIVQFTPAQAAPGTLLDYLGVMSRGGIAMTSGSVATAFPLLAYHLIWNDWYRNSLVQKSLYMSQLENAVHNFGNGYCPAFMKWWSPEEANNDYILTSNTLFADNSSPLDLRQRNFGLDYFTMATPSAQNGDVQKVSMQLPRFRLDGVDSSQYISVTGGNALKNAALINPSQPGTVSSNVEVSFTIPALRAVNSMQQFLERNNLIGNRLVDYVKGQYGATLKDSIAQRPVYLGSFSFPVYSKGVYQSNQETSQDVASQNPFNSVGARYGHAYAEGNGSLIDFTAEEPGYIMVIGSLVPEVTYSSGVEPYLSRYLARGGQSDMANPILQNVGNEPIYRKQLDSEVIFDTNNFTQAYNVFGYVERYASWKTRNNQLHGLLRDTQSLDAFALQRSFTTADASALSISSAFLEIPTNYMDQVSAVQDAISDYGVWVDCYFKYGVSMPLYQYSLPSLQDPAWEHGNVFTIPRGGNRID